MADASPPRTRLSLNDTGRRTSRPAWDAYAVWRVRVRNGEASEATLSTASGWDPYEIWLTRVKQAGR